MGIPKRGATKLTKLSKLNKRKVIYVLTLDSLPVGVQHNIRWRACERRSWLMYLFTAGKLEGSGECVPLFARRSGQQN